MRLLRHTKASAGILLALAVTLAYLSDCAGQVLFGSLCWNTIASAGTLLALTILLACIRQHIGQRHLRRCSHHGDDWIGH